jgi:hypothetical protein
MRYSRTPLALAPLFALAGCVSFLPNQRAEIYKSLTEVNDQLIKAKTAVAVESTPTSTPYSKVEPYYIAALASAQQAQAAAERRETYYKKSLPALPASNSAKAIAICYQSIEDDRKFVKDNGIPPNYATNIDTVASTCSIGKTMEDLFKK